MLLQYLGPQTWASLVTVAKEQLTRALRWLHEGTHKEGEMQNKSGDSWTFILTKAKLTERVSALFTTVPQHAGFGWHWLELSIGVHSFHE